LFHAALAIDPQRRADLLRRACPDESLRREVASLLAADARETSLLASPLRARSADLSGESSNHDPLVGTKLGEFQILRRIAAGGMGAVYEAQQEHPRRRVAIKTVRFAPASPVALRRFEHESQILGGLLHPGIAEVHQVGTHRSGVAAIPYFVMDYIDGVPITDYADQHTLTVEQRVDLFRLVCEAVHYAHQNLVIHRDLKPANILVTADGAPKLVDFGIAKLIDQRADQPPVTQPGMQVMTPEYASPEQVRGDAVTTSSDVYSLGVVLYELLTRRRPYDLAGRRPTEVERIVCEQAPSKPSTVALKTSISRATSDDGNAGACARDAASAASRGDARKLRRRLTGDLDNIVLMAMRKEPARRYASVLQFSDDLKRHLSGLPVIARKDTPAYRSSKFILRNRAGVLAAGLIVAVLLIGMFSTVRQARIAARQRDRAVVERRKAERVTTFLQDMFASFEPQKTQGNELTIRAVLDQAAAKAQRDFADDPEIFATICDTLGRTYRSLGFFDDAERHLRCAFDKRLEVFGPENALTVRSMTSLALTLQDKGKPRQAEMLYRRVLDIQRRVLGPDNPGTIQAMNNLGWVYFSQGALEKAEPLFREALAVRRRISGPDHPETLRTQINLAGVLRDRGEIDEAERLSSGALASCERVLGERHPLTLYAMRQHVWLLKEFGRLAEAERLARRSLELDRAVLGAEHPHTCYSMHFLAAVLVERHRYDEAEPLLRETLKLRTRLLGKEHPDTLNSMNNLGSLLLDVGRTDDAAALLEFVYAHAADVWGPRNPVTLSSTENIALLRHAQGRCTEAETLLRDALSKYDTRATNQRDSVGCAVHLAELLYEQERFAEAADLLRARLGSSRGGAPLRQWPWYAVRLDLAKCLAALQDYSEAEQLLSSTLAALRESPADNAEPLRTTRALLADLYNAWGKPSLAARYRNAVDPPAP